jgi:hypothetical protein
MFLGQLLQGVEGFLIDEIALLDPALNAAAGANTGEAAITVYDLHAFAIFDVTYAVVDGGHLVAQTGLRRRHVGDLQHAMSSIADGKQQKRACQGCDEQPPARK